MKMVRQKWITIGEVQRRYVIISNSGFPGGFVMAWRGKMVWCQSTDFIKWPDLLFEIRRRLNWSGLALVDYDLDAIDLAPTGQSCPVRVFVRRSGRKSGRLMATQASEG